MELSEVETLIATTNEQFKSLQKEKSLIYEYLQVIFLFQTEMNLKLHIATQENLINKISDQDMQHSSIGSDIDV